MLQGHSLQRLPRARGVVDPEVFYCLMFELFLAKRLSQNFCRMYLGKKDRM